MYVSLFYHLLFLIVRFYPLSHFLTMCYINKVDLTRLALHVHFFFHYWVTDENATSNLSFLTPKHLLNFLSYKFSEYKSASQQQPQPVPLKLHT